MSLSTMTVTGLNTVEAASMVSSRFSLPGSGAETTVVITNLGPGQIVWLLGDGTVAVTPQTGFALGPNWQSVPVAKGANDHIAIMTVGGQPNALVNIATGS